MTKYKFYDQLNIRKIEQLQMLAQENVVVTFSLLFTGNYIREANTA